MTTRADSEVLTSIGAGTPVGNMMREYWIPAAMSSELRAGGDPMRLMLLGEKLIAFRDSTGRVGIMDHRCPHRCASLFFGRNEDAGLRCAYHGWKFDVDGNCLDMPNVPPHGLSAEGEGQKLPGLRAQGLIWTYMGKRETAPPLAELRAGAAAGGSDQHVPRAARMQLAAGPGRRHRYLAFRFLHTGGVTPDVVDESNLGRYAISESRAGISRRRHRLGHDVCGLSTGRSRLDLLALCAFPVPVLDDAAGRPVPGSHCRARMGADGRHPHDVRAPVLEEEHAGSAQDEGRQPDSRRRHGRKTLPNDTSWYGRWRLAANAANDYMIDRELAAHRQLLRDRRHTSAGSGDDRKHGRDRRSHARASCRQRSHDRPHAAAHHPGGAGGGRGDAPPGVDHPEVYHGARGGDFVASSSIGWLEAYSSEMVRRSIRPAA